MWSGIASDAAKVEADVKCHNISVNKEEIYPDL